MTDWAVTIAGGVLVAMALVDVYSTILHYDADGPIGRPLRRLLWKVLVRISRSFPRRRRTLLGYAGPMLVGATFLFWFAAYIVGFALIVYPHMDTAYRSESEIALGGFIDALYYSGVTASVLGYGDISPVTGPFKVLAFVHASLGFFLFTSTVTYALMLLSGASERNALGNDVRRVSGGRWSGATLVIRLLPAGATALASTIRELGWRLGALGEKLHHFPILDLYYRSEESKRDPEPMLACLCETVLALHVLSEEHPMLQSPTEELEDALEQVMRLLVRSHMKSSQRAAFRDATPDERDERRVEDIRRALIESSLTGPALTGVALSADALSFAARTRSFLDSLDDHTGWRIDHGDHA